MSAITILFQLTWICLIVHRSSQLPNCPVDRPCPPFEPREPSTTRSPPRPPTRRPIDPPLHKCSSNSDTIFLLDSSGSIGKDNFKKMLDMTVDMSESYTPIGTQANQVGVEVFSETAATKIRLKDYSSISTLSAAIMNIDYIGRTTYTNKALKHMCNIGFSAAYGDRPSAKNIGIVMTDGYSTRPSLTIQEARACRNKGVTLIAIPIGNRVNMEEIEAIAGSASRVLPAKDFDELLTHGFLQRLAGMRCVALASSG